MNSALRRTVTVLISLFLLSYVGYQAYLAFYHPMQTVRAQSSTVRSSVEADSVALFEETPITADIGGGVVDYIRQDGERVPKGGAVARVYANEKDVQNQQSLQQISGKIARLTQAGTSDDTTAVDLNVIDNQISQDMLSLAEAVSSPGLETLPDIRDSLLDGLNKKQLATGEVKDFGAQIAALQQQAAALQAGTGNALKTIASPVSGYYVSTVDGYEGTYDYSKITQMRPSDIQKLETAQVQPQSGCVGKVVSQYEWYIVCVVGSDDAQGIKEGAAMTLRFPLSSQGEVPVTVAAVNRSGDSSALIFRCEYMTSRLAAMRRQTVQIVKREITGIRVNNDFVHIIGGQKGVFVLVGTTARFKKIVPLYSGNGYTMSEIDSTDSTRLQVYDSIIQNGEDLHDGQVVK